MYGLTTPQKSIFLTEQYYKNTNINNVSGFLHICDKNVDTEKLELGINNFIQENEQFRARFFLDDEQVLNQYYKKYRKENYKVIELKDFHEKKSYEKIFCNKRFNIIENKLYRFCIYKLGNGEGGVLFSAHHLICDAWSITMLIDTVVNTYTDVYEGNKPVEYQYKTYIADEQSYYKSDKYKLDEEYWKNIFSKSIDSTNKNLQEDITAQRMELSISEELLGSLLKIDNSFFNLYLSALSIYFSKINSQDSIIIGTPLLNRKNFVEKQIVGMFVNTLPLRIDVDRDSTFKEFISNNKQREMQLFRHQKMNYDRIMKIAREANPQINSLFDITISYQNARDNHKEAKIDYNSGWVFDGCISNPLDVHICDLDNTGQLKIMYDYQISKFDEEDIIKIHNRIIAILEQLINDENVLISDVSIITEQEKEELDSINNIEVKVPENATIIKLFKTQVKKNPHKIAISFEGEEITYEELDNKSDKLANVLSKKGIVKSDIVAIFLPKSLDFFICMLGILKAGATYLPIDVEFPDNRVNYILNDSKAKLCITDDERKNRISVLTTSITKDKLDKISAKENEVAVEQSDNCYIIYTSGTTGEPKGVVVTHKNVVNYTYAFQNEFHLDSENDVVLQQFTPSFDAFVEEFYPALVNGIKILSVSKQTILNSKKLEKLINDNKVTLISCSPLLLNQLNGINNFSTVKTYISGGDVLKKDYYTNLIKNADIYNTYGPTETTVCSTYHKCTENEQHNIPIGKTIANYKNYIVSEENDLLPKGSVGELCIGGKGLTRGYLNNPALTANKFILLRCVNEYVFKTGDLCKINDNDEIEFVGRKDDQVKIRGYRVSLIEIEKMLCLYPLINNAIVVDYIDNNNKKRLCAYYIGEDSITKKEIKEYLKKVLPSYMIPDVYIKVNEFKMTINGKIDKLSLPNPIKYGSEPDSEYVKPRTEVEKQLAEIWSEILNIKQISIEDNLFELGADSLAIIEFQTLAINLNININAQEIYESQTIKKIAEKIENQNIKADAGDKKYRLIKVEELKIENTNQKIENVLLTGVTGFLGIHVLKEILNNSGAKIYCLVRGKDDNFAKQRLRDLYRFYFNKDLKDYIKRLRVIYGDITKDDLGLSPKEYKEILENVDTVLHCAATVKHYGNADLFYKINVLGTINIIDFCKASKARLHHISTISVSGQYTEREDKIFTEKSFWIGQNYSNNEYVKSKFEAEYEILKEIQAGQLYAKIYRVGNLTGRFRDGIFQKNIESNVFYKKMMSIIKLRAVPIELKEMLIDFTPIDLVSNAIFKLVFKSTDNNVIYHLYNDNTITLKQFATMLNELGFKIKIITPEEVDSLSIAKQKQINELMLEINPNVDKSNIIVDNEITNEVLNRIGFEWKTIDKKYLLKIINYVREVMSLDYEDN